MSAAVLAKSDIAFDQCSLDRRKLSRAQVLFPKQLINRPRS